MELDEIAKYDRKEHEGKEHEDRDQAVTVSVNEQPVKLHGHSATGAEIKAAAIAQGVHIQLNFVLQEELPNGTSRIVGDHDKVHLREHLRFTAIAPDDNS
jgi:Multiubiquitin